MQGYNDLASIHPALAAQWHPTRNGALSPGDVSCHSDQIIWWQCAKGHVWRASISHRTCGTGCPVCAGKQVIQGENDLASRYPALAAQWHPQKNGTLLPTQITPGSGKSIWWQCGLGHAFCQTPARRVKGSGCPYCANKAVLPGYNDLASVSPQLAAQWHPDKNGTLTPQQVLADSNKKVWWQYHGYSWQERIRARRQTPETPNAGLARYTSFAEQAIFYYVRRHFFAINRYRKIENREIDIFVPELALGIEHDGPLHNRAHVKRRDLEKEAFLASRGIELIRVKTGKRFGAAQRVVTYPHGNWAMLDRAIEQVLYLLGEAAGKSCAADVNCQRDQCAINRQFWENPHKSALTIQTPEAADYWDRAKNGALDPDYIAYTSKTKVWWKCPLGHRWQASVGAFSAGSRCPYCCGKKVLEGFNDLAFIAPELAAQWHPQFNGALTPKDVTRGAMKKVWWQCQNGHAWQATVRSRIAGCGCPYCSGRLPVAGVNDLATTNPKMARQWHPEKNGMLTPSQVSRGSGRPVWWRCAQGHQWRCPPGQRQTDACPFCSGRKIIRGINDLAACRPDLMRQWHEEKNVGLDPGRIGLHSNKKAWWRCEKGHQWQAVISSRVSGCGCPFCSGRRALSGFNDLASAAPALAAQWHPDRNGALTPQNVTRGSGKKVWWRCAQGHEWQAVVAKRSAGQGCPVCARAPRTDDLS